MRDTYTVSDKDAAKMTVQQCEYAH